MSPHSTGHSAALPGARGIDLERVRAALVPVLVAQGVELFDIEWLTERAGWTLRVMIEREVPAAGAGPALADASGGVTLEDCVEVSRAVSAVLDADEEIIPHAYHLEVSSPGLDRKLRGPADFVRFRGHLAKVKLARPAADGQRVLRGPIEEAPEGRIALSVDGKHIEAPATDVVEARLVYELPTGEKQKKGKPGSGKAAGRRERGEPR